MARIVVFNGSAFGLRARCKMMSTLFPITNISIERNQPKSTEIDVIDSFISRILNKRADKLKVNVKKGREIKIDDFQPILEKISNGSLFSRHQLHIRNCTENDLDNLITIAINADDCETFDKIIEQLLKYQILPSEKVILKVLLYLCKNSKGDVNKMINDFVALCQLKNLPFHEKNCKLAPFVAQCLWESGNYKDALNSLYQLYSSKNTDVKATVRQNYRILVKDAFTNKGEAITITVTAHAIEIYKTYNDASVLMYVWCDSFTSDIFTDKQLANQLFSQYEALRKLVSHEISRFCFFMLQCHDTDAVRRLIEQVTFFVKLVFTSLMIIYYFRFQLLAFNMKEGTGTCLSLLFDYLCKFSLFIADFHFH